MGKQSRAGESDIGIEVPEPPVLLAHILFRLDVGGLETVLVHLINRLPADRFRHVVICLTECTDFRQRICSPGVAFYALHKRAGQDFGVWVRLYRLLKKLRPLVVHTFNIAALESHLPAFLAGVPVRIHAEHGRDWHDLTGDNWKLFLFLGIWRVGW
ncbi:MAG: glycosyltransferase [Magnetococcus sp. DMHC-6]